MSSKKKMTEKQKREKQLKEAEKTKKRIQIAAIVSVVTVVIVIAGALIFDNVRSKNTTLDYSAGLKSDGMIKGIKAGDYVDDFDLSSLDIHYEDYYPTEEEIAQYIDAAQNVHPDYSEETGKTVSEGDRINVDFVGYINGEEYEGGNTGGNGMSIKLGSSGFPEGFDDQIIGHKTGETFDITLSFADDFGNPELAGQEVVFTTTINGIYHMREFNDEFVKEYFSEFATTVDEFKDYYKKKYAKETVDLNICKLAVDSIEVDKLPSAYVNKMKNLVKAKDVKLLETTNSNYLDLYGKEAYKNVAKMKQMTNAEYKEYVKGEAEKLAKEAVVIQALYDQYGLTVSDENVQSFMEYYGYEEADRETAVERFGEPYINQQAMKYAVEAYLCDNVVLK